MRETFVLDDLLHTLIQLETKGNILYSSLMASQEDETSKTLFGILADQELNHKKLYESLLGTLEESGTFGDNVLSDEYKAYIDVLLKGTIDFLNTSCDPKDKSEAFEIAVRLEKDTLMFLGEVKKVIASHSHELIDRIQSEEQKHLQMIYAYWGYTKI